MANQIRRYYCPSCDMITLQRGGICENCGEDELLQATLTFNTTHEPDWIPKCICGAEEGSDLPRLDILCPYCDEGWWSINE